MAEVNPYQAPQSNVHAPEQGYGEVRMLSTAGRMGRLRYIAYSFAASIIVGAIIMLIGLLIDGSIEAANRSGSVSAIIAIILSLLMFAVIIGWTMQRLHDFNASGAWVLLIFVPLANVILMIMLMVKAGNDEENRFGKVPLPNTLGVKILAFISIALLLLGFVIMALFLGVQFIGFR